MLLLNVVTLEIISIIKYQKLTCFELKNHVTHEWCKFSWMWRFSNNKHSPCAEWVDLKKTSLEWLHSNLFLILQKSDQLIENKMSIEIKF